MSTFKQEITMKNQSAETQWRSICTIGSVFSLLALIGIVLDVVIGSITGGNLSALPQTAVDRFAQLQKLPLLGLYNLDLLNLINQLLLIPAYFALSAAHRKTGNAYAQLALIIFLVGTSIFVTTNSSLPMLELSNKYANVATESQKILFASAGEAMLARGAHGSLGVFIGFLLPTIAGLIMSFAMLSGKVFNKTTSYLGLIGNAFLLLYIILITFAPGINEMATIFAMPGGLLSIGWMILYAIQLFKLGRSVNEKNSDLA